MQFLRQQRKGRKRKTFLERIGLNDSIESADKFYAKYNILNKLKSGGQGTIYSVERKSKLKKLDEKQQEDDDEDGMEGNETKNFEIPLVVKIICLNDIDDIDDIQTELIKILNEYELTLKASLLNHYGIYYDDSKKEILILTERLKYNLDELKYYINDDDDDNNKLNEDKLKCIMTDILNKLNILHEIGYIHCDINPFNLMCDNKNEWKLIDYDMMTKIDDKKGYIMDCWKGTIGWISSEIGHDINSSNNRYSFSSDIWSFGLCLLYILNDFKNPFDLTTKEILENNLNGESDKLEYYYKYKLTENEHFNKLQCLLITWWATDKISFNLYDLLLNHLLVFNQNKRIKKCKHIIYHPWFYQYIKKNNKDKYQFYIDTKFEKEGS